MDKKLIARYVLREVLSLVGTGAALFWSAGRLDWWQAWAVLGVLAGWLLGTGIVVIHYTPELLAERLERRKGEKSWDAALVSLVGLVTLIRYIVAGEPGGTGDADPLYRGGAGPALRLDR